jgi:hypothetical protein
MAKRISQDRNEPQTIHAPKEVGHVVPLVPIKPPAERLSNGDVSLATSLRNGVILLPLSVDKFSDVIRRRYHDGAESVQLLPILP